MPHSSSVIAMNTPTSTNPQGNLLIEQAADQVAIKVACGARTCSEPMPNVWCRLSRSIQFTNDDVSRRLPDPSAGTSGGGARRCSRS